MQNELYHSIDRLLSDVDVPAKVRALDQGSTADALWQPLQDSGFLDMMVSEGQGGAGLGLRDAWPVIFAAARHGLPLPVAQTIFARALLADCGIEYPMTPLAIAGFASRDSEVGLVARDICGVRLASHVLAQIDQQLFLLPVATSNLQVIGTKGCFDGNATWSDSHAHSIDQPAMQAGLLSLGLALGLSVQIAGAADRVLQLTLSYANDRSQFGKPIGKFQAVQQQIAEMAECVYAARMASQIGCQTDGWQPLATPTGIAKAQASEVAPRIAAIAHAVHAAIGVTQEYDLQLCTRRLYEWARCGGGALYWSREVGAKALESRNLLDFVREQVF